MRPIVDKQGELRRVVLRGGVKGRVATLHGYNKAFPIVVLIETEPYVIQLTNWGRFLDNHGIHRFDLPEHEVYVMNSEVGHAV